MKVILTYKNLTDCKLIGCPVCWGKRFICIGLNDDLTPIVKPCTGCEGTGWLIYKTKDERTNT